MKSQPKAAWFLDCIWGSGMDLIELNTNSFIVKIWLEEPAENHQMGKWRGHITHVPSGERRYLKSLGEIVAFIVPYLVSMGVRLEVYWRLRSWLWKGRDAEEMKANRGTGPADGLEARGALPVRPDPPGGRPSER